MKNKLRHILLPSLNLESKANSAYDVDAMLLSVAYHRIPLTAMLAFVTVLLFGPLYYFSFFKSDWMLGWIAIVLLNYAAAALVFTRFAKLSLNAALTRTWRRAFIALSLLSGLAWSFGPVYRLCNHFDSGEAAILCVSLLCVSGVTVALLQGQRLAMIAYLLTALTPTTVVLLYKGGALPNTLALLLFTATLAFAAVGFDFYYALRRLFETQAELAQSAREASEAKDQAERSTALKSQFVANVSHEIRTPMHAILGMLRLMQSAELNERQADYARKVEVTAKSLLGLLNDILDFSKIEAEHMELSLHPFRLDRMLHDLSVVLSSSAQRKAIEVLYDIDPVIPKVLLGDAMRLRQVLLNIAGNAIKFTTTGEVVLRIRRVAQTATDCTLHFSVKDTGIGIAPENLSRIFTEFVQASAHPQQAGGSGLGLSISKRLVSMMGGDLQVHSTPGEGSTFYFELTLQSLDSTGDASLRGGSTGSDLHVLVIDGGATARELAVSMCRSWGWTVEATATGEGAAALMRLRADQRARPFDLVIVDWALPGMDGWQTIEALDAVPEFRPLPEFIMVSGYGNERLLERSATDLERIGSFLPKPFTASMLFDAIVQARSTVKPVASTLALPQERKQRLMGVRVLVVEDNLMNQQVVKELLELEGASVEVVGNGQQAVDLLADMQARGSRHFDAVLMDLQMPNMDGYVATRIIRNELGLHNLPVIAITANMMATDKEASFSAGMNAHIGKPFNIDLLVRVIQKEHAVTRA